MSPIINININVALSFCRRVINLTGLKGNSRFIIVGPSNRPGSRILKFFKFIT